MSIYIGFKFDVDVINVINLIVFKWVVEPIQNWVILQWLWIKSKKHISCKWNKKLVQEHITTVL